MIIPTTVDSFLVAILSQTHWPASGTTINELPDVFFAVLVNVRHVKRVLTTDAARYRTFILTIVTEPASLEVQAQAFVGKDSSAQIGMLS